MEAKAHLKYVRISPRKVQIVLDLIRGKDTETAMAILKNTNKIAAESLVKLLKSAVANAQHNFNMDAYQHLYWCLGTRKANAYYHGKSPSCFQREDF